jgi:hypothetical protein
MTIFFLLTLFLFFKSILNDDRVDLIKQMDEKSR